MTPFDTSEAHKVGWVLGGASTAAASQDPLERTVSSMESQELPTNVRSEIGALDHKQIC